VLSVEFRSERYLRKSLSSMWCLVWQLPQCGDTCSVSPCGKIWSLVLAEFFFYIISTKEAVFQCVMHSLERIVVPLPWCWSVCLSGRGVHCDHMVHVSADLSRWLCSPMFWAPWHQSMYTYSQPSLRLDHLSICPFVSTYTRLCKMLSSDFRETL